MTKVTEGKMQEIAIDVLSLPSWNAAEEDRIFRGFFGASIGVITTLWNLVEPLIDGAHMRGAQPKHLLWALVLVKVYSTEDVHRRIVGWPDSKTYRKWSWYFLDLAASLRDDVIELDKRLDGVDPNTQLTCLMSVDGTDCPIMDPWPFDPKWYSEKFFGPGLKYDVGVSIFGCDIVWINGPFVASTADSTIFIQKLTNMLADDEGVEVDKGYKGVITEQVLHMQKLHLQKDNNFCFFFFPMRGLEPRYPA
jgi:hypothetical protein